MTLDEYKTLKANDKVMLKILGEMWMPGILVPSPYMDCLWAVVCKQGAYKIIYTPTTLESFIVNVKIMEDVIDV